MPTKATTAGTEDAAPTRSRRGTSKPRAGNDQEQRMINVAAQMFYERGYDATSIQEVADKLGLLKGSLYHYINSKDDLLWAIISRQHTSALALAERCRATDDSPTNKLTQFVLGYIESLEKEHVFVSVYLHDINRLSTDRRKQITREREAYTGFVVDTLNEGKASGEFRQDIDAELTSNAILGMLNSTYRWYRPGARNTADTIIRECLTLILGGISAK